MRKLGPAHRLSKRVSALGIIRVGLLGVGLLGVGCSDGSGYAGPMVRLSASFNNWAKGERAPSLAWDGSLYRGVAVLPGDALQLRIYAPYTSALLGGQDSAVPVPATLSTSAAAMAGPLLVETPLSASYELEFDPVHNRLHVDFAPGAEQGQPPGAAELIAALRGSDRISADEKTRRADQLMQAIRDQQVETPLRVGTAPAPGGDSADDTRGLTFLQLGAVDYPEMSVVGDFNGWTDGHDMMQFVLDGRVAYLGRLANGVRLEYRLALHGMRYSDPQDPEVVWDGAYLPPNLLNILGGNVGDFNSIAMAPGYVEQGSRLRRLVLPKGREIYVYLPPGYDLPPNQNRSYPSLYIHDGKDAIVRGRYNESLDRLIANRNIPPLVAVFIPAQSDADMRLSEYAMFTDMYFADIAPNGPAYEDLLITTVLPQVESTYRVQKTADQRAMLGIDLAGALSFHLAFRAQEPHPFQRIASQSGRFGWGAPTGTYASFVLQQQARLANLTKLSLDWAGTDQFQVAAQDQIQQQLKSDKIYFFKQDKPLPPPSSTAWDNWRTRLDGSLTFLFSDLVGK